MDWQPIDERKVSGRVIAASTYITSQSGEIKDIAAAEWRDGWLYKFDGEPFYDANVWCEYVEPTSDR